MTAQRWIRVVLFAIALITVLGAMAFDVTLRVIASSVRNQAAVAQQAHAHPGDDVAALLDYVASGEHPFRDRNRAVWALGQLRDPRALPVLQAAYTGAPCDHGHALCQRELERAIRLCGGQPGSPPP